MLFENQSKMIDDALGLMGEKLKKEMMENCAPQDEAIVTNTAILMLRNKEKEQEQIEKQKELEELNNIDRLDELQKLIKKYHIRINDNTPQD